MSSDVRHHLDGLAQGTSRPAYRQLLRITRPLISELALVSSMSKTPVRPTSKSVSAPSGHETLGRVRPG